MSQVPSMTMEQWLALQNWQAQNAHIAQQNALKQQTQQQRRNDALSWEYQNAMNQANQANETRYADILQLLGVNRQDILGDINQWGESQVQDANQRYKEQAAAGVTDAYNRGFGGSPSVLNAARNQANKSRDAELARIRDNQISQRVGAAERTTNNIAGVMERRNDVPPDLNQLIGLQRNLGQAGPLLGIGGRKPPSYTNGVLDAPSELDSILRGANTGPESMYREPYRQNLPPSAYQVELYGGVQNPFLGGGRPGWGGAQQAQTPFVPLKLPNAPAPVGYTGLGEQNAPQQVPYSKPMGYAWSASDMQMTPNGKGGYMPLVAPVQQQLPTVPGMVGGTQSGGYMMPSYGNMNTGYNYSGGIGDYLRLPGSYGTRPARTYKPRGPVQRFISAPKYAGQPDIQYV